MAQSEHPDIRAKKLTTPTTREINTACLILRGVQLGLTLSDIARLEVGELMDLLIESANDSYKYPKRGTAADFARLFGG